LNSLGELEWRYSAPTAWHIQIDLDISRGIVFYPSGSNLCAISYKPSEIKTILILLKEEQEYLKEENREMKERIKKMEEIIGISQDHQ